jgi:hypothetical protein
MMPKQPTLFPTKKAHSTWARLIARVYEVDPLVCPRCSSSMRWSSRSELLGRWRIGAICTVLAVITEPEEVRRILRHLVKIAPLPAGVRLRFA